MDITKIRAETPGLAAVNHLLACGSSLPPQPVVDATIEFLQLEARIGGYEAHHARAEQLDNVYHQVATLIGAQASEIALTENATVAWCHAFYALPLQKGQRILTCEAEYAANYVALLHRAERDGLILEVVPSNGDGELDLEQLQRMMDDDVALIAMTWIPTNGGLVNPAKQVGDIARQHNAWFLLDACQAVGQMPIDVSDIGCDFLSATGRKFLRGPRGTGFLYVKQSRLEGLHPAIIDHFGAPWVDVNRYQLRDDARRFENWENAYALRAGLGVSVQYALDIGLDNIQQRAWGLANYFRERLHDIPHATCVDLGATPCAIVSFTIDDTDPYAIVEALREQNIMIGASDPPSTLLDASKRELPDLLRVAPHYYNSEDDIDALLTALLALLR